MKHQTDRETSTGFRWFSDTVVMVSETDGDTVGAPKMRPRDGCACVALLTTFHACMTSISSMRRNEW